MRLWTLHPKHLDSRGLVAVWREALLAQAVLRGLTRGYTRHPQLERFREARSPLACIARYLAFVHEEAQRRGYSFDRRKIGRVGRAERLPATEGQVQYEWRHLAAKLVVRDRAWLARLRRAPGPEVHPLFRVVRGPVEPWEVGAARRAASPKGRRSAARRQTQGAGR